MGAVEIAGIVVSAAGELAKLASEAIIAYTAGNEEKSLEILDRAIATGETTISNLRTVLAQQAAAAKAALAQKFDPSA